MRSLTEAAAEAGVEPKTEWVSKARQQRASWEEVKRTDVFVARSGEKISQGHLVGIINDEMQEGDTLLAAAGTVPSDLTKLLDVAGGKLVHIEFGNSCMGYDIPAAIGVKLTGTRGEVLVLMGDGNYQMHPLELITAVQERTKITVVLNVNNGYQSIHGQGTSVPQGRLGQCPFACPSRARRYGPARNR